MLAYERLCTKTVPLTNSTIVGAPSPHRTQKELGLWGASYTNYGPFAKRRVERMQVAVSTSQGPPRSQPRSCFKTMLQYDVTVLLYLSSCLSVIKAIGDYKFSENSETHFILGCARDHKYAARRRYENANSWPPNSTQNIFHY